MSLSMALSSNLIPRASFAETMSDAVKSVNFFSSSFENITHSASVCCGMLGAHFRYFLSMRNPYPAMGTSPILI